MSEKKHHVTSLYEGIPAVAGLNQVQGFDPRRLLRRTASRTGNGEVLKLDLRYKKLWFRLAHPQGRLKLNALRITEQLAIFEARIYLDRSDAEPIGNFTATCTREEALNGHYIKAAQEAALDEALTNAGFGLQFADVCADRTGEPYGSEIPLSDGQIGGNHSKAVNSETDCRQQDVATAGTAQQTETMAGASQQNLNASESSQKNVEANPPVQAEHITYAQQPAFLETARVQDVSVAPKAEERTVTALAAEGTLSRRDGEAVNGEMDQLPTELIEAAAAEVKADPTIADTSIPNGSVISGQVIQEVAQSQSSQVSYTADMPVAEIIKRMTFEEAQRVKVDEGTCSGWTMAEVAERRPPSLKWYVYGYKKNNNILRAAAQIMWDSLNGQKAG